MTEDRFENNNSQDSAYDFGVITEDILELDLTITDSDSDWFEFSVDPFDVRSLQVSLEFDNSLGDLELQIIDFNEQDFFSTGSTNTESLLFNNLTQGDYLIQVFGEANPDYSLNIDISTREFDETITLDVDTIRDQNDGGSENGLSLRDAILIANDNPSNKYIINLQPGETYSLTKEGTNEDFGTSGDLDIRGNVTIKTAGEDADSATIDGSNLSQRDRIFEVRSYFTDFPDLRIENRVTEGQEIFSANLALENVTVSGGRTQEDINDDPSGGGIYVSKQSFLKVTDSTITDNGIILGATRRVGSALYSDGNTTITNSQFTNNYFEQQSIPGGIGIPGEPHTIYHQGAKLTVADSAIEQNNDAGIDVTRDFRNQDKKVEAEIINSTISDNQGIGLNVIETDIIDSTISNNTLSGISAGRDTNIVNSTISYNGSAETLNLRGGQNPGILVRGENVSVEDSTVSNNFTQGIATQNVINGTFDLTVENSIIAFNQQGGIEINNNSNSSSTATISNSIIASNTVPPDYTFPPESAGGLYVQDNENPQISLENTVIANNEDVDVYGAVRGDNSNLIGKVENSSGSIGTGTDTVDDNLNVRLAPLGDYGEATQTHALYGIDISGEELDRSAFAETIPFLSPEDEPEDNPDETPEENTIELFRFRNTTFTSGTYIFVGEAERDFILNDENLSQTFALDGVPPGAEPKDANPAFTASTKDGNDFIPFYRLESLTKPGTFLFVSTAEYEFIFDDPVQQEQWKKQGFADESNTEDIPEFYLYEGSADEGTLFNRFQNMQNDTFLYAGEAETAAIENDDNLSNLFNNQGPAFRSL